jgi:hypothetical protein
MAPIWADAPQYYFYRKKRFQSDYQGQFVTVATYDAGGTRSDRVFAVDRSWRQAPSGGRPELRPEPLFSVLDGANSAIDAFVNRSVAGDKVGLDAFAGFTYPDHAITRVFPLTGGNNHFQNLKKATNTSVAQWDNSVNFETKYLFPGPNAQNTNIYLALQKALNAITNDPYSDYARSFVVLITDGLTNCDKNRLCDGWSFSHWKSAMDEIETELIPLFVNAKIALHVIMVGKSVEPNTLNYESSRFPGQCMDPMEAWQDAGTLTVEDGGCGAAPGGDITAGCPLVFEDALLGQGVFHGPNGYLARWAMMTQGGFFPVREADPTGVPGQVAQNASPGIRRDCSIQLTQPGQRQIFDPYNRSTRDQIRSAFESIMGSAAFSLFQPLD